MDRKDDVWEEIAHTLGRPGNIYLFINFVFLRWLENDCRLRFTLRCLKSITLLVMLGYAFVRRILYPRSRRRQLCLDAVFLVAVL